MSDSRIKTLCGLCVLLILFGWLAPLHATPVAYWTFDNTADDVVGGNNGLLNGAAGYSGATPAAALSYSTGSLALPGGGADFFSAVPTTVTGAYTISAWLKLNDIGGNRNFFDTRGPSDAGFDVKFRGADAHDLHADIGNGGGWLTTAADARYPHTTDTWYHVAYVVDGSVSQWKAYVGGLQVGGGGMGAGSPVLFDASHDLRIGGHHGGGESFAGYIDDVAVWNSALTGAEIANLAGGASPLDLTTSPLPADRGAYSYIPVTDTADTGIGPDKLYTHKIDFGGAGALINGVQFDVGSNVPFPRGNGATNQPNVHGGNGNSHVTGDASNLFDDFVYNAPNTRITLTGLTPGQSYDTRLYLRAWGTGEDRSQLLGFDTNNDGLVERVTRINPDNATDNAPGFAAADQAFIVSYNFVAEAPTAIIHLDQTGAGTVHAYGVSNELTPRRPIPTLYSSGLDANGVALAPGTPDPHYELLPGAAQGTTSLAILNHPAWAANNAGSTFIGPVNPGDSTIAVGSYNYRTTFDLTGFQPGTAELTLTMFADNTVQDILFNGASTGINFSGFAYSGGSAGKTFTIDSGFVGGVNELTFLTTNDVSPGPGGFRVEASGSAEPAGIGRYGTGTLTSDNHWALYVGKADGTDLRLVGRDMLAGWETPESLGFFAENDEHLFVVTWDNPGATNDPQMWIGDFRLPDGTTLGSNATNWKCVEGPQGANPGNTNEISDLPTTGDLQSVISGASWATPQASMPNNSAPWGGNGYLIDAFGGTSAEFVWSDSFDNLVSSNTNETYVIFRAVRPVPEPSGIVLVLVGLVGLAGLRLRKK